MTNLAASIVQNWVRLYTIGFEASERERIRQEVESDLWEQMNGRDASSKPIKQAGIIILRWLLGIPVDVQWAIEESKSAGLYMWTRKFISVLTQRRLWLVLLIVSGVSLLFIFFGIAPLILGIIIVAMQPRRVQQALNRL